MSKRNRRCWWLSSALLAGGVAVEAQDPPVAAPTFAPISAAPAMALKPIPMSEFVQQQPDAVAPVGAVAPEQAATPPASLAAPTVYQPVPVTVSTSAGGTQPWSTRGNVAMPGVGSMGSPMWRWYGWGAATPQGFVNSPAVAVPTSPAPANMTPAAPPVAPVTTPAPMPSTPVPATEVPKVMATPVIEPVIDANSPPLPAPAPDNAPPSTAPAIDMNSLPKPVPAPVNTGPAVEPWTGVSPPGAKGVGPWRTVRASSAK